MRQHVLLAYLSPVVCLMAATGQKGGKAQQKVNDRKLPNVMFIYTDDPGYDDLECYGVKNVQTPHVNRLAVEGIRFNNAHATAVTSIPSRYSMLTREYTWRRSGTDIVAGNVGMIIRPERYTMADMFRNAGYATAAIGKWHLGLEDKDGEQDWNAPLPTALGDIGFDYSYIMAATVDRVPCVLIENGKMANYDPSTPIEVSYRKPIEGESLGKDHPELLFNPKSSHGYDMAIVNDTDRIGYIKGGGKALWEDENIADSITSHTIDFIREHKDEPFFMYFATNDVHVPRFPHDHFRGKNPVGLYGDAIVQFDWGVGQIMDTFDKLGLSGNTLIMLFSDNGPIVDDGYQDRIEELLNGHSPAGPLRGDRYSAFGDGIHIPAIVRWPKGAVSAEVSNALVSQIDWLASLASSVGAGLPRGTVPDSSSFPDTWLGKSQSDRSWVIEQASNHTLLVCTRDWKYAEPNDGPTMITWGPKTETGNLSAPQLYHVADDVAERKNEVSLYPERVLELQNILRHVRMKNLKP